MFVFSFSEKDDFSFEDTEDMDKGLLLFNTAVISVLCVFKCESTVTFDKLIHP